MRRQTRRQISIHRPVYQSPEFSPTSGREVREIQFSDCRTRRAHLSAPPSDQATGRRTYRRTDLRTERLLKSRQVIPVNS